MKTQNTSVILLIATFGFVLTCEGFGIGIGGHFDQDQEESDFFGGLFGAGRGGHGHQQKQRGFGCEKKQRKGHARTPQGKSCHDFQLGDIEHFEVPINRTMGVKECICNQNATNVQIYSWNCTIVDTKILGTVTDLIPTINGTVTSSTSLGVQ